MQRNQTIPVRASTDEKTNFSQFAKKHSRSLSEFARSAMEIIMRNPSLLEPSGETARLMLSVDKYTRARDESSESFREMVKDFDDRISIVDKKLNRVLKNQKTPDKEVQKLNKKQDLGNHVINKSK